MYTSSFGFVRLATWMVLGALACGCSGNADDTNRDAPPPQVSQPNAPPVSPAALNMVYTVGNAGDNTVIAFRRTAEGVLEPVGEYPTEGNGSGGLLGNQGALASNGQFIIVVNPESDDISVLKIEPESLRLVDRIPAGGIWPLSVAIHRDLVYVVNAGSDNIAGFRLSPSGVLSPLAGSEYALTGDRTAPAQISFAADGAALVVTEKLTSKIVTFPLTAAGLPRTRYAIDSATRTPYGFAVYGRYLVVSEEADGRRDASATSSYRVEPSGELSVVSPSVTSLQSAACWVAITPDRRFAYVANTASNTISSYRLDALGRIELIDAAAAQTVRPLDIEVSPDGKFLHALNLGLGTITTFGVAEDGSLSVLGAVGSVPTWATGLISH